MAVFQWANGLVTVSNPDAANMRALFAKTGPFWQDTARTVAATTTGDPVKCWDDTSGLGNHWTWASGNVPTLRAGGGINVTNAILTSSAGSSGSSWSLYSRHLDGGGAGLAISDVSNPVTTYIEAFTGGNAYIAIVGAGAAIITDPTNDAIRGMVSSSGASVAFVDSAETALGAAATLVSLRMGSAVYPFTGEIINCVFYNAAHGAPTRSAVRNWLATV